MAETRFNIAQQALRSGGELISAHLGNTKEAKEVEPGHVVMPVDLAVNQLVIDAIRKSFATDSIFTEESGYLGGGGEYLWVVDPVDGTSNLMLGIPYATASIAIQYKGETIFSAVFNPFLDEMIIAERGGGAFANGERLQVSSAASPSIGYYIQGYRVPPVIQPEILRVLLPESQRILNTWAPTLDWCNVSRGCAEFLVCYDTEAEDLIQGKLILEEAGGKVTTWNNRSIELDLTTRQRVTLVATNGFIHDHLCELLSRVPVAASLREYISPGEQQTLSKIAKRLSEKLDQDESPVSQRISGELGLPQSVYEQNAGLQYIVTQAEALRSDPLAFLRRAFGEVAPHLSGEGSRKSLLDGLARVAENWEPQEQPLEIVAQALEITASDIRIHDQIQLAGYGREIIEPLKESLPADSLAVGVRLKRNAFRTLQALESIGGNEVLDPPCRLAEISLPRFESGFSGRAAFDGFAALIITGGRGTRLRTSVPKGLVPLDKRPLVDHAISALRDAGARHIAVVVGYKDDLHRHVLGEDIVILEQSEQLGTAHAVMIARSFFEGYTGPLLVSYSDMPFIESHTLRTLVDKHCADEAAMTLLTTERKRHPEFGRVIRSGGKVLGIGQVRFEQVESDEVDAGFYCFKAPDFWHHLGQVKNANNRREFVLTEVLTHLSDDGQKVETCFVDDPVQTIGINRPSEYIQAERIAYARSKDRKSHGDEDRLNSELYRSVRFYESFGGIRADEIIRSPDETCLAEVKAIVAAYDAALAQQIGSIFRCPDISRRPRS